jgi:hypothetical protein
MQDKPSGHLSNFKSAKWPLNTFFFLLTKQGVLETLLFIVKRLPFKDAWEHGPQVSSKCFLCKISQVAIYQILKGKLPLALMNYRVSAICPHELPRAIPDPIKLPNPSQHPPSVNQFH